MDWFKAYSNGILRGSLSTTSHTTQLIWFKMVAMANETRDRDGFLRYKIGKPYTHSFIAEGCHVTINELENALKEYLEDYRDGKPRIQIDDDGTILLTNWDKYQSKTEKQITRELSIQSSKRTKRSKDTAILALIRCINELNTKINSTRFTLTGDGRILDSKTGEVRELSDINKEFNNNGS
jgi:hypothetical protein